MLYNISHPQPKVVVSANCAIEPGRVIEYKPLLDQAIEMSNYKPETCIILNREYKDVSRITHKLLIDFIYLCKR